MKKILAILATVVLSLTACADRHQLVESSELPAQAQAFIKLHFNMSDITYVERDRDGVRFEYKVYFKDATEVEFDYQGNFLKQAYQVCVEFGYNKYERFTNARK